MFNWKPNKPNVATATEIDNQRMLDSIAASINDLKVKWEHDRADLWKAIKDLSDETSKPPKPVDLTALEQRMAVLDTWRAQLHTLLTERGNTGKEKLSKTGNSLAKFYGR